MHTCSLTHSRIHRHAKTHVRSQAPVIRRARIWREEAPLNNPAVRKRAACADTLTGSVGSLTRAVPEDGLKLKRVFFSLFFFFFSFLLPPIPCKELEVSWNINNNTSERRKTHTHTHARAHPGC